MTIVPFEPAHLARINLQETQRRTIAHLTPEWLQVMAQVSEPTARRARASNDAPDSDAEKAQVGHVTVKRARESVAAVVPNGTPEKRLGRDGKQYTATPRVTEVTPPVEATPELK